MKFNYLYNKQNALRRKGFLFSTLLLFAYLLGYSHDKTVNNTGYPFIENKGQWHENVFFQAELNSTVIFLEKDAFHYQVSQHRYSHAGKIIEPKKTGTHSFKARFLNTSMEQKLKGENQSQTYYNFFLGNDPSLWKSKVYAYETVNYKEIYDGIDLKVYYNGENMKYDFMVAPGKEPSIIQMQYEGVDQPKIRNNRLVITHELGKLIEEKPYAYQIIEGKAVEVKCQFYINENGVVSFQFPKGYDESKTLIIDPKLIFSTYSGSPSTNFGMTSTFDSEGNGYVGGVIFSDGRTYTNSTGFFQSSFQGGSTDIVISKFNSSDGSQLLYSTYLGGNSADVTSSLVVDSRDNLIVLSYTSSANFPISSNAFNSNKHLSDPLNLSIHNQNFSTGTDIAITKLSKDGKNLLGSTFFGGEKNDGINYDALNPQSQNSRLIYNHGDYARGEVVVDSNDNIYIGSSTRSTQIDSTLNSLAGEQDGIVAKFNSDLSQLYWSRYVGGSEDDAIYSIKVIDNNRILIGGGTRSFNDFPVTPGAYLSSSAGGRADGFISIISADGQTIEKSTFIGTSKYDQIYYIEYDRYGYIYGFGITNSEDFPIKNSSISNPNSAQFIVKLDPQMDSLEMSHVFGDTLYNSSNVIVNLSPTAFLVDRCLNIYISGWGGSVWRDARTGEGPKTLPSAMPLKDAFQATTDNNDFYLYAINNTADSLIFASYLGGAYSFDHVDGGTSRFDKNGVIYQSVCASCGTSSVTNNDFPTTPNAYARSKGITGQYGCNSALFKYDFEVAPVADFGVSRNDFCLKSGDTIAVTITNSSHRGDIVSWDFYGNQVISNFKDTIIYFTSPGNYTIKQTVQDTLCILGNFETKTITIRPNNIDLNLNTQDSLICNTDSVKITAFHKGAATHFTWSNHPNFQDSIQTTDSTHFFNLKSGSNTFYVKAYNPSINDCGALDSITIYNASAYAKINIKDTICENSPVLLSAQLINIDAFKWDFGDGQINTTDTIIQHLYNSTGEYDLIFTFNNTQCPNMDTIRKKIVVQKNDLRLDSFSDTLFCGNGDFIVKASSLGTAHEFHWSSQRDFSDTLNSSPRDSSFIIRQPGNYKFYIKISDKTCELIDSIETEYFYYELDLASIPDSVCAPITFQLSPIIIGTDSFRINFGNGNSTTTDSTPKVTYLDEGTYTIELIGSNSKCDLKDTLRKVIHVFKSIELETIKDTTICLGDSITLRANSFGTATIFIWDTTPNFNNPLNLPADSSIKVLPSAGVTTYYLRASNEFCYHDTSIQITAEELLIELSPYEMICIEDTLEIEAKVLSNTTSLNFFWSPNDSIISGQNTNKVKLAPRDGMKLFVEVTNAIGCKTIDSTTIDVSIPAFTTAEIIAPDSAYSGEKIQLKSNRQGSNLIYRWEPAELMDNPASPEPIMTITETTLITLIIFDMNTNCVVEVSKLIKVYEIVCEEPEIFIPSAFTPNKDGKNDVLYVRGRNIQQLEFEIYNRWGELVFKTNDINKGWDGSYKGKSAEPAVYVYQLKVKCVDQQEFYTKGNLTLIR